jgi:hypothetical protein
MFFLILAEVSIKGIFCLSEYSLMSLESTFLSSSKSHLFPTRTIGNLSLSLIRKICLINVSASAKLFLSIIEKT